ncbi:MAG: FtsH protease activity modulator HflK [Hyphomicrobiaceae bacterium]
MPWSNQGGGNGGPWGKGGGPWGQGPSSGGQPPGDFEDILKRGQDRFRQAIPGGGMNKGLTTLLVLLGLAAAAFYLCTVRVNPDEQGIVTRFGKFDRTLTPGLNLRLPYPIEEVYLPKVTKVNPTEIGRRGGVTGQGAADDSLMLTGDENIVNVDFVVNWQIRDAEKFLFNIRDGEEFLAGGDARTVRDVAESAVREVVGTSSIQPILTQRAASEQAVRDLIQKTLDSYNSGIYITQVQFLPVDPPSQVVDAFRDVQAARADQERLQNEAQAYANSQVPLARGDAEKILQEAQAYKERVIAESSGQAERFSKIYEEYRRAPDVTRQRMFLETMERVFGSMDKIIIDQKQGGSGVVPYLPLNELARPRSDSNPGGQ